MSATGPIIVSGSDRSGTTLLYALLGSHPAISMVRRTNLWRWFDRRYGDLGDTANLDRCLDALLRYQRLAVLQPDRAQVRAAFLQGAPTYGRLFDVLHRQHADRRGRRRWADKSLHTEFHADRVFAELPDARIIHMVRDPRDRYASIVRRYVGEGERQRAGGRGSQYDGRTKGIGAAMGRWRSSLRQGHRNLARYPTRYLFVRYETLASAPVPTLRHICAFLDEEYDATMLRMDAVAGDGDWAGNSSFGRLEPGTVSIRSIGRYRSVLTPRQIAFIQTCARGLMDAHDYAPDPLWLTPRERSAFYLRDLPLGLARLLGWQAMRRFTDWRDGGVPEHRLTSPVAT
jgi:hypothetical protein